MEPRTNMGCIPRLHTIIACAQRMAKGTCVSFNIRCSIARDATRRWALFGVGYELYDDLDFMEIRARMCVLLGMECSPLLSVVGRGWDWWYYPCGWYGREERRGEMWRCWYGRVWKLVCLIHGLRFMIYDCTG
jgi:hypothetical protein